MKLAFELAVEEKPIDFYKDLLNKFEQERIAEQEALAAAAATPKKGKKKTKGGDDEDADMADADASAKSKTKKRKAEDGADVCARLMGRRDVLADTDTQTPQRPDSVKKPKIKLNTNSTPKGTNGAGAKDSAKTKTKGKKATPKENVVQETPEESLKRRQVSREKSREPKTTADTSFRKKSCTCATSSSEAFCPKRANHKKMTWGPCLSILRCSRPPPILRAPSSARRGSTR